MRRAGVLLHPTALPQGVLDENVEIFLDWMVEAGLRVWQMLPLVAPHPDGSPYQAYSAHALNPALLPADVAKTPVDDALLAQFSHTESEWLNDYVMFVAIHEYFNHQSWSQWPELLRIRDTQALERFSAAHEQRLTQLKWEQYLLFKRWDHVRQLARERDILLFGDMPIAVAYDSAAVWVQPQFFKLDAQFQPTVVAGVPPDYFSTTGQRWGNPHYNWKLMEDDHFAWWRSRMASALRQFDLVRIDHFRGLVALWEIPVASSTAEVGQWVETPGRQLLEALRSDFPTMPFVAEDLGVITPEVLALRQDFSLPGLSVLQFGFPGSADNPHSLISQVENSVVYSGTHDNNTTVGWFKELDPQLQQQVLEQLPQEVGSMPWPLIEAALHSVAQMAIIPMQDWLALDGSCRTNTPGTSAGNWSWQFSWEQVPRQLAAKIRESLQRNQRYPHRENISA
jgi:4-alpha-glucanotransferase